MEGTVIRTGVDANTEVYIGILGVVGSESEIDSLETKKEKSVFARLSWGRYASGSI